MNNIKDYRKDELRAYVIGNILVCMYVYGWFTLETMNDNAWIALLNSAIVSTFLYIFVYMLDTLIPADWKDTLVYLITGRPGDTIFTRIKEKDIDSRFTKEQAKAKYADIYTEIDKLLCRKEKQKYENSQWYGLYKKHETEGAVYVANRDFLLNRDMSFMTINMAFIYLIVSVLFGAVVFSWNVLVFLIVEFLVTNIAARGRACKFTRNVIAADIWKK